MSAHRVIAALVALAGLAAVPAEAQYGDDRARGEYARRDAERPAPPPRVIAKASADNRDEHIVFKFPRRAEPYSELRIRPVNERILLDHAMLTFADGRSQRIDMVDRLMPGEESRPIVLEPGTPLVAEITLVKRASWRPGEIAVELVGTPRPEPEYSDRGPAEQRILARMDVDRREERIPFRVGRGAGPLDSIEFSASDQLLITRVEVEFGRGERQTFNVTDIVKPGETSRAIRLGEPHLVESVILWKRPSWRPGRISVALIDKSSPRRPAHEPPPGAAIPRDWMLLGTDAVDFAGERKLIPVGSDAGKFERIAIRVLENDIFLREITVVYGNGERDRKLIESPVAANGQTRAIPLKGDRFIQEIELVYRSRPDRRERAIVEVFGDFSREWFAAQVRDRNQGKWLLLGAQRASMFQKDNDAVIVGERFGRLKAVRLAAKRSNVRFYSVRVIYGNGEVEELPVSLKLSDGNTTPVFELGGRGRFIDRIELKYRSQLDFKGQGIVEIWGRT